MSKVRETDLMWTVEGDGLIFYLTIVNVPRPSGTLLVKIAEEAVDDIK
jgi:hypothetical protein